MVRWGRTIFLHTKLLLLQGVEENRKPQIVRVRIEMGNMFCQSDTQNENFAKGLGQGKKEITWSCVDIHVIII